MIVSSFGKTGRDIFSATGDCSRDCAPPTAANPAPCGENLRGKIQNVVAISRVGRPMMSGRSHCAEDGVGAGLHDRINGRAGAAGRMERGFR